MTRRRRPHRHSPNSALPLLCPPCKVRALQLLCHFPIFLRRLSFGLSMADCHRSKYEIWRFPASRLEGTAYSYVRAPSFELPTVYLIDANGMIRNSWVDGVLTKDIFEGNGLASEIDKLLAGGGAPAQKKWP